MADRGRRTTGESEVVSPSSEPSTVLQPDQHKDEEEEGSPLVGGETVMMPNPLQNHPGAGVQVPPAAGQAATVMLRQRPPVVTSRAPQAQQAQQACPIPAAGQPPPQQQQRPMTGMPQPAPQQAYPLAVRPQGAMAQPNAQVPPQHWRPAAGQAFGAVPNVAVLQAPSVRLPPAPDKRLVLLNDPDSARAVSFRLLRDNLLAKRLPRVIAVTSAMKKDGKTTCASNLALSLAEGARVLLLEGNLYEPALAAMFVIEEAIPPIPNAPWLAAYRIGEVSRTLHVAAPPVRKGQPPARFEKQQFDQMIGAFRRYNYDFVIIDAAALSASPTVSQLVGTADGTILAVRSGVTTARALRRASEQIPEGKAIGVALVDAKPT